MKLGYDGTEFECDESIVNGLIDYAKNMMEKMQKAETEFADCWTACCIEIDENLQPTFSWGSIEDVTDEEGFYVELPLAA